ncbi:ABC transporter permease [Nocardioides aquiterrae]|uniref:Ribose ABC transporter permease RbsC n=1 Tax=Nocardioides aquiterrae TaxID=203799 RepID=A0ABN1U904_9ACTN
MSTAGARLSRVLGIEGLPIVTALVAVSAYFALTVPAFVDGEAMRYYLNEEVPVFIITAGMALVIIAGGIDLSVGAVLGLSAGTSLLASMHGADTVVAVLVGVGTGAAFGLLNGLVIVKLKLNDFIVTLGTLNVAAGLLVVLTDHVQITGTQDAGYLAIANTSVLTVTSALLVAGIIVAGLQFVLVKSAFGRMVRAVGGGTAPALVAGIDAGRVKVWAYVISGTLAGVGGVLLASRLNSVQPGMAGGYELSAIAAAVLGGVSLAGGRGAIWQAAAGCLLLATLKQGFRLMGVDPLVFSIIIGVCILVGVIVDRSVFRLAVSLGSSARSQAALPPVQEGRIS